MKAGDANKAEILDIVTRLWGDGVKTEHRFHSVRMWRFDYAIPEHKIAIEYHGHAGFVGKGVSGHSTIKGLTNDCEKLNQAQLLGWQVIAFTALHFKESERVRHKLESPLEILLKIFAKTC
jgi:hypothetical protein